MNFKDMSDKQVFALYRIGRKPGKGLQPFFKDPRTMIALRDEVMLRKLGKTK